MAVVIRRLVFTDCHCACGDAGTLYLDIGWLRKYGSIIHRKSHLGRIKLYVRLYRRRADSVSAEARR